MGPRASAVPTAGSTPAGSLGTDIGHADPPSRPARFEALPRRATAPVTGPPPTCGPPLEYGCHLRDVGRIFGERLELMLDEDEPQFANWDQDETAAVDRYDLQDPAAVAVELAASLGAPRRRLRRRAAPTSGTDRASARTARSSPSSPWVATWSTTSSTTSGTSSRTPRSDPPDPTAPAPRRPEAAVVGRQRAAPAAMVWGPPGR